jgi:hypothetical protein
MKFQSLIGRRNISKPTAKRLRSEEILHQQKLSSWNPVWGLVEAGRQRVARVAASLIDRVAGRNRLALDTFWMGDSANAASSNPGEGKKSDGAKGPQCPIDRHDILRNSTGVALMGAGDAIELEGKEYELLPDQHLRFCKVWPASGADRRSKWDLASLLQGGG